MPKLRHREDTEPITWLALPIGKRRENTKKEIGQKQNDAKQTLKNNNTENGEEERIEE